MKTVFITGGASGAGAASVKKFLSENWNVVFMDKNCGLAARLQYSLDDPDNLLFVEGDVTGREDIRRAVMTAVDRFGQFDSVVVNAMAHRQGTLSGISDDELRLMIDTNIYGTVNTLREALPWIIKSGGGSVVINVSDRCDESKPDRFAYDMTMGALGQLVRSLSADLGMFDISVNCVGSGTPDEVAEMAYATASEEIRPDSIQ